MEKQEERKSSLLDGSNAPPNIVTFSRIVLVVIFLALYVMAGRELVTLRSGCCKEPMCVSAELWRTRDGVYCPKCGVKVLKPRAAKKEIQNEQID